MKHSPWYGFSSIVAYCAVIGSLQPAHSRDVTIARLSNEEEAQRLFTLFHKCVCSDRGGEDLKEGSD
jgi:hypothetical protein